MSDVPADLELLRPWFNLCRRLHKAAKDGGLMGVLTVRILVDEHGVPRHWTAPERTTIEPRVGNEDLGKLLDSLGGRRG